MKEEKKDHCKLCDRELKTAIHWSNRMAIDNSYCCVGCMFKDLGAEETWRILGLKKKTIIV